MDRARGEALLIEWFADRTESVLAMASSVSASPAAIADVAADRFRQLLSTMPYVDNHDHPMASSAFECAAILAVYLAARELEGDVDVHEFGRAALAAMGDDPVGSPGGFDDFVAAGLASQEEASPNEFVFDVRSGDGDVRRSIDITSRAICAMFGPHDAMDLVPYMCAMDDVVSDRYGQGLRRTGSIALGASHCDFRFTGRNGEPLALDSQYPQQIQLDRGARSRSDPSWMSE